MAVSAVSHTELKSMEPGANTPGVMDIIPGAPTEQEEHGDDDEPTLFSRVVDTLPSDILQKLVEHVVHRNPATLFPVMYSIRVWDVAHQANRRQFGTQPTKDANIVCWSVRDCLDQIARMESAPGIMRAPVPFGITSDQMTHETFMAAILKEEAESPSQEDLHSALVRLFNIDADRHMCAAIISRMTPCARSLLHHLAKYQAVPCASSWTTSMIGGEFGFINNVGTAFCALQAVLMPNDGASMLCSVGNAVLWKTARKEDEIEYVNLLQKWLRAWEPVDQAVSAKIAHMQAQQSQQPPGSQPGCVLTSADRESKNGKHLDAFAEFIEKTLCADRVFPRDRFDIACVGRSDSGCEVRYAHYSIYRTKTRE